MIPDYQSLMLPILKILSDKKEHSYRELIESLANEYQLTNEERKELLSSGTQPVFDNRVGWAKTYLKKAGLISSPRRATFQITEVGLKTIEEGFDRIDVKYLRRFPAFVEFEESNKSPNHIKGVEGKLPYESGSTPLDIMDVAYRQIRDSLASELIDKIINLSPAFFEKLVVDLLVRMGYGGSVEDAGKAIGRTGDEGLDGTIKEDKLGLDIIYIQAKRWKPGNTVGRPELQKFVGALAGQGSKKGIFITTSNFSKEALEYVPRNETKIVLINGEQLAQLMIDYNLGCTIQQAYEIKKIDLDYFGEE